MNKFSNNKINKYILTVFFTSALFFSAFSFANAATYYVDVNHQNASDNNAGTETQPFKTIQKAADVVGPGDTVIVEDGTYTGSGQRGCIYTQERNLRQRYHLQGPEQVGRGY